MIVKYLRCVIANNVSYVNSIQNLKNTNENIEAVCDDLFLDMHYS